MWKPGYLNHVLAPIAKKLEMSGYRLLKGCISRIRIQIIQMKIASNNSMWRWKVANTERKLYNTLRIKTLQVFGVFKIMQIRNWISFSNQRAFFIRSFRKSTRKMQKHTKKIKNENRQLKSSKLSLQSQIDEAAQNKQFTQSKLQMLKSLRFTTILAKYTEKLRIKGFAEIKTNWELDFAVKSIKSL